jgi:hypothetical protein
MHLIEDLTGSTQTKIFVSQLGENDSTIFDPEFIGRVSGYVLE